MKDDLKPETLTELNTSGLPEVLQPLFKYTVILNPEEDAVFLSDSWNAVVNFLIDQDDIKRFGEIEYNEQKEGRWNDDDCRSFVEENIKEYAEQAGYQILEAKS